MTITIYDHKHNHDFDWIWILQEGEALNSELLEEAEHDILEDLDLDDLDPEQSAAQGLTSKHRGYKRRQPVPYFPDKPIQPKVSHSIATVSTSSHGEKADTSDLSFSKSKGIEDTNFGSETGKDGKAEAVEARENEAKQQVKSGNDNCKISISLQKKDHLHTCQADALACLTSLKFSHGIFSLVIVEKSWIHTTISFVLSCMQTEQSAHKSATFPSRRRRTSMPLSDDSQNFVPNFQPPLLALKSSLLSLISSSLLVLSLF